MARAWVVRVTVARGVVSNRQVVQNERQAAVPVGRGGAR